MKATNLGFESWLHTVLKRYGWRFQDLELEKILRRNQKKLEAQKGIDSRDELDRRLDDYGLTLPDGDKKMTTIKTPVCYIAYDFVFGAKRYIYRYCGSTEREAANWLSTTKGLKELADLGYYFEPMYPAEQQAAEAFTTVESLRPGVA